MDITSLGRREVITFTTSVCLLVPKYLLGRTSEEDLVLLSASPDVEQVCSREVVEAAFKAERWD
jgi:hypothetical protein